MPRRPSASSPPAASGSTRGSGSPAGCPAVRTRAWLEWNGRSLLGRGRIALLEQIEQHGSISAAARALGVSYRGAWSWIAAMNEAAGTDLVLTARGGRGGGGATLSPTGKKLLLAFHTLAAHLTAFNARLNRQMARLFREAPAAAQRRRTSRPDRS